MANAGDQLVSGIKDAYTPRGAAFGKVSSYLDKGANLIRGRRPDPSWHSKMVSSANESFRKKATATPKRATTRKRITRM